MARPWVEGCIEAAYRWTDDHGLPRRLADEYRVEWAADLGDPLTDDDDQTFWLSVPILEPPSPELDEWGCFIAVANKVNCRSR